MFFLVITGNLDIRRLSSMSKLSSAKDTVFSVHFDPIYQNPKFCLSRRSILYHSYMNKNSSIENNVISLVNFADLKVIKEFVDKGFEITPGFHKDAKYLVSNEYIKPTNIKYSDFIHVDHLENFTSTNTHYNCQLARPLLFIRFTNAVILPILLIIVALNILSKKIPLKLQSTKENSFTIIFCSTSGHILTPVPSYLPKTIINILSYNCRHSEEHQSAHNVFMEEITTLYKIIFEPIGSNIIMITIFHLYCEPRTFDCQTQEEGTRLNDYITDKRVPVTATLKFNSDRSASASYNFKIDRQDCTITMKSENRNIFALGRQGLEIERIISIQEICLYNGLKAKPDASNFISSISSFYTRLNYKAIIIDILENGHLRTIAHFCNDKRLDEEYSKTLKRFKNNEIKDGDLLRWNAGEFRIGVHSITVETTRYICLIAVEASSSILRSIEYNSHAILTMLIAHNHSTFISRGQNEDVDAVLTSFLNLNIAYFEVIEGKIDWVKGTLFNEPVTKESIYLIYKRLEPHLVDKKLCIKFVCPIWLSHSDRRFIAVNAMNLFDVKRNVNVLTCMMRDVTYIYKPNLYEDDKLMTSMMGAVMLNLQRVKGKDKTLDFRLIMQRFFGELPPEDFSMMTKVLTTKELNSFSVEPKPILRFVKKSGIPMLGASVPAGNNGDFFIYPTYGFSKASPELIDNLYCHPKDDPTKTTGFTLIDIARDTYTEFRILMKTQPFTDWTPPQELLYAPKCRRHLEVLAGSLYRKHARDFMNAVTEALKTGHATIIAYYYEVPLIKPLLVDIMFVNGILSVSGTSLMEENYIAQKSSMYKHALDGVNPTGHIIPWTYNVNETGDGIYTKSPGGVEITRFSLTSLQHVIVPEHRMKLEAQIATGVVHMPYIIKFDEPKWFICRGLLTEKETFHGILFLVPSNAIPSDVVPGKKANIARNLYNAIEHMCTLNPCDMSDFKDLYDFVSTRTI